MQNIRFKTFPGTKTRQDSDISFQRHEGENLYQSKKTFFFFPSFIMPLVQNVQNKVENKDHSLLIVAVNGNRSLSITANKD